MNNLNIFSVVILLLGQKIRYKLALHPILDKLLLGNVSISITVNSGSKKYAKMIQESRMMSSYLTSATHAASMSSSSWMPASLNSPWQMSVISS